MFVRPMNATQSKEPFDDNRFIAEVKLDGFRMILSNIDGLRAYTRNGNECTEKFPELLLPPVEPGTVLDGEMVVLDKKGKPDFEAVLKRLRTRSAEKIERLAGTIPAQFVAFDIIFHRGKDVTHLPLMQRKALLETTIRENDTFSKMRFVERKGIAMFEACKAEDLEGIVLKQKDSRYIKGKSSNAWQKVINYRDAQVFITGYHKNKFGWLIGIEDDNRIRPVGTLELGAGPKVRNAFYPVANTIKIKEDNQYVYIEPKIQCKVKFKRWTSKGNMREAVFQEFCL